MTLRDAKDGAWESLSHAPVRRYLLGRDRCDRLVRIAMETVNGGEFVAAGFNTANGREICQSIEERVAANYTERCSGVFTTLILSWAIQAIVQYLIRRWWKEIT